MEYLPFVCRITNVKVLGKEFSSELQPVSVQRVFIVSCAVYLLSFSYELNSVECGRKGHNIGYKGLPPKNKESTEEEEENSKAEEDAVEEVTRQTHTLMDSRTGHPQLVVLFTWSTKPLCVVLLLLHSVVVS